MPFATPVNPYSDIDPRDERDRQCVALDERLSIEEMLDRLGN
jgi:hypothetical protein